MSFLDVPNTLTSSDRMKNKDTFVRCPNGRTLLVSRDDCLSVIQRKVFIESGLRSCYQVLHCNAKPLLDAKLSLRDYGITENATIFVSSRTKGGCFMVSFSILIVIAVAFLMSLCTCGLSLCVVPFLLPLLCILPLFCL
jgi:hypothetical protein